MDKILDYMYHYINGLGYIWIGTTPPVLEEFPTNVIWLKPTNTDTVWELLGYDCNNLKWVQIGNSGDIIDPNLFSAEVTKVASSSEANALVTLENTKFKFEFDLPKGEKGDQGNPGDTGSAGADGSSIEFIYKLAKTEEEASSIVAPESLDQDNYVPSGWTDHPSGISQIYQYEVVCTRTKSAGTTEDPRGHWGIFVGPSIWSKWGIDGKDGDGVEYIYIRTNSFTTPSTPVAPGIESEELPIDPVWGKWTDNPIGVNSTYRWEWVSVRKFTNNTWGAFSTPSLWAYYSKDGEPGSPGNVPNYVIYVYYQSDSKPSAPNFNTPTPPEGSSWKSYPTTSGSWWQCVGQVDGLTNLVTNWGEVIPLNGKDGQAQDGKWVEFRFAKSSSWSTPPALDSGVRTPSGWALNPPSIQNGEYLWLIKATILPNDTLNSPWSTPICLSGEAGIPGNWTSFIFKMDNSTGGPSAPISRNPVPTEEGWQDAPSVDNNKWWMSSALIDGITGQVKEGVNWATPKPIIGEDGAAGTDGVWCDFKFSVSSTTPTINKLALNPGDNWKDIWEEVPTGQYLWMTFAYKTKEDELANPELGWADPRKVSGEKGEQGPAGNPGISGTPGINYEIRFAVGTESGPNSDAASADKSQSIREPEHWSLTYPASEISEDNPIVWFIQNRIIYSNNEDKVGTCEGPWSDFGRYTGEQGPAGPSGSSGKNGQIIYPAGLFSTTATYQTTEEKAPYVFVYNTETSSYKYYLLNKVGSYTGQTNFPESPYPWQHPEWWEEFTQYKAIYSDIGIFGNALVGSAVFNKDYMFSQSGIDESGEPTTNFDNFNPEQPIGGTFTPNILLDFKTGNGHLGAGKIRFEDDKITTENITIGSSANFEFKSADQIDYPAVTTFHAIISPSDSSTNYPIFFTQDLTSFEIGNIYEGVVINDSTFETKLSCWGNDDYVTSFAYPGNYYFDPEQSGKVITSINDIILNPGATLKYLFKCTGLEPRGKGVKGTIYISNPSDFILTGNGTSSGVLSLRSASFKGFSDIPIVGMIKVQFTLNEGFKVIGQVPLSGNLKFDITSNEPSGSSGPSITINVTGYNTTSLGSSFSLHGVPIQQYIDLGSSSYLVKDPKLIFLEEDSTSSSITLQLQDVKSRDLLTSSYIFYLYIMAVPLI